MFKRATKALMKFAPKTGVCNIMSFFSREIDENFRENDLTLVA